MVEEDSDAMRNGGDAAKTEVVTYYFADLFEKLWQRFLGYEAKALTPAFAAQKDCLSAIY